MKEQKPLLWLSLTLKYAYLNCNVCIDSCDCDCIIQVFFFFWQLQFVRLAKRELLPLLMFSLPPTLTIFSCRVFWMLCIENIAWQLENNIESAGAVAIAKKLPSSQWWSRWRFWLLFIDSDCSIDHLGAKAIAKSLPSCPLRILSLDRIHPLLFSKNANDDT